MIANWINKISNKIYFILLGISLLISLYGIYIVITIDNEYVLQIGLSIFIFFGLLLMLKYSQLIYENKHIRIIYFLIGLLLIGIDFKIQHYPGGRIIYIVCSAGFLITYLHRYINKKNKKYLDHLKIIWVTNYCINMILSNLSIWIWFYISFLGLLFFIYMFSVFVSENRSLLKN